MTTTVADDSHNHVISNIDGLQSTLDSKVPTSRTVNGKALSSNVTLTASDLGAIPYDNNRIDIPENADLNDYTTVGAYRCSYNAYAATLANSPITSGFIMDVVSGVGINNSISESGWVSIVQRLYGYRGEIYTRRIEKESTSSTPTYYDWVKTYTTSAKPTPSEIGAATTSHTHNYAGSSSAGGVANSASKLATARTITLDGDVTGSVSFDGSKNITITTKGVGEREHDMNTDGCYFEADLTASTYDQNTWYPIVGSELNEHGYTKISCNVQLDNTSHPTWATHGSGFVCNFTIYAKEFGWGTTNGESYVTDWFYNWCAKNPLGYQQMSNSSRPVIFARGGGLYPIRSSEPLTWTVCSTTFTDEQQSVSPTTTEPGILFNKTTIHAHLSGDVIGNVTGTATKASTGSLNRVTHSYNEVPAITTYRWEEFSNSAANAPTAQWYHTFTGMGYDPSYATQLALGMTTNNLAYRRMDGGTWGSWDTILTSRNYKSHAPIWISANSYGTYAAAIIAKHGEGYHQGMIYASDYHPTDMPATGNWSAVWWRTSCGNGIFSIQLYIDRDPNIWLGTLASGENNNQITWGKVYTTRSSTFSGNATSATQLQTARTINGTSFNGTANITTANWGTARTIKIGNTGKSVNGSNNVTWTLSEIGAAASSHTHNYAGSSSAGGAANSANKLNTNAGHTFAPVYFSNGVPVACTTGQRTNSIAVIGADSVMEIGSMIDFHAQSGTDYDVRMTASSGKLNISGTTTGTFQANNGTDYTTSRCRNARFGTSAPSSLANGEIFFVYE